MQYTEFLKVKNISSDLMIKVYYQYQKCNIVRYNKNGILYYNQLGNYHYFKFDNIKSIITIENYYKTKQYKFLLNQFCNES